MKRERRTRYKTATTKIKSVQRRVISKSDLKPKQSIQTGTLERSVLKNVHNGLFYIISFVSSFGF